MKKIILVILALILVSPSFAKHRKRKKKKATTTASAGIQSVNMHRTTCFGRCPDYFIEIKSDGTCTYTSVRFTPDTGIFQKNIGTAAAMDIINQLTAYRIDTCRNLYDNRIPDLPSIKYTITYKDSVKSISNANFGPGFLKTVAENIDNVGRKSDTNTGWKKISGNKE